MIGWVGGDILRARVDAVVNAVNTAGVMGQGLALQLEQIYPDNFAAYARACRAGSAQPRYVINFPTQVGRAPMSPSQSPAAGASEPHGPDPAPSPRVRPRHRA